MQPSGLDTSMSMSMGSPEAGGGGFPSWLPTAPSGDRPLIYADFKDGHYWASGAIQTDITTILYEDANWGNFDPATDIVPGTGLINAGGTGSPALLTSFIPALVATGCTWVFKQTLPDAGAGGGSIQLDMTDFTTYANEWAFNCEIIGGGLIKAGSATIVSLPSVAAGSSGFAFTFKSSGNVVSSQNGDATVSLTNGSGGPPVIPGSGFDIAGGSMGFFAIYAPQPDADLPALSTP